MAKLRGVVTSDRNSTEATRLGDSVMGAMLNTHEGQIRITLAEDGRYTVVVNGDRKLSGNLHEEQV